jgi:hypothetical protein
VCKKTIYERKKLEKLSKAQVVVSEKVCDGCGVRKPAADFSRDAMNETGLHRHCKQCDAVIKRRRFLLSREVDPSLQKIKSILKAARKREGINFNLDLSDLMPFHNMEYCSYIPSIKLNWESDLYSNNSPTLDRIDPSKGYVKGNVRIISKLANTMRNDASIGQLLEFCNSMEKLLNKGNEEKPTLHSCSVEESLTLRAS